MAADIDKLRCDYNKIKLQTTNDCTICWKKNNITNTLHRSSQVSQKKKKVHFE